MGLYTPLTPSDNAIRKFADAKIQESMNSVLKDLPAGKSGALILYADQGGVRGAIYGRKPAKFFGLLPAGEWSYVATAGRSWSGKLEGSAALGYSW